MGDSSQPPEPHPLSQRPIYTSFQLSEYISHIFPPSYSLQQLKADVTHDPLAALTRLQLRQLARVPWGNAAMHYSMHRALSLDAEALFVKIVRRGLGGYCMENNVFFATVLRSLGYRLYAAGARVSNAMNGNGRHPDGFSGWGHMVLLVAVAGRAYLVDVGFGSQGSVEPLLLEEGTVSEGVPGNRCRLVKRAIAQNLSGQEMWVFEMKNSGSADWQPGYCFGELEFLPEDFEVMNFRTHRDPTSWFTYTVVVTRVLREGEEDGGVNENSDIAIGTVTVMNGSLSRRVAGTASEKIQDFKNEAERIQALEKWFGIKLLAEEVNGIAGMATQIRPSRIEV